MKFKDEDVKKCLMHFAPKGWKFFSLKNEKHTQWVKVRKPYEKGEIKFNEDGFKYETIFLNLGLTNHYLYMTQLGYDIKIKI